jgi:GntR family transcriptional regulator
MNVGHEPELILQGGAPIHRQIRDQIRACILSGQLDPGEQLPTPRALAVGLSVNPNTIARAYAWLEREGFVTTEEGSGTFVAVPEVCQSAATPRARVRRLCSRFLALAARRGFTAEEVIGTLMAIKYRERGTDCQSVLQNHKGDHAHGHTN